ncbi:serine/threonine-protein kinase [Spirillospora sp. NPDC029432]|uniref:serine/threonine-protein kinase n=1 Tax=Spirillospora sp. NPDC029432 TaxID=3154599 RepID=UPI003453136C
MSFPPSVGRYRIDRVLGSGAFASVLLGHDEALDSQVAIKVLSGSLLDDLDVRNRFLEEARILRRADSARLVRVHDIGELPDGRPYFVMSYADRGTLADRMRERPLPAAEAIALAEEIAYGVEVINTLGVIHRDLKPSNVLFQSAPDGGERLLIADLGLAKALAHASGAFTLPVGTPGYMSPEQARFGGGLDVRADVYGLGALTYHMLTGRPPGPPPVKEPPSALRDDLTPALDQVVLRALESEREKRWPTAEAFAEALATLRPTIAPAERPAPPQEAPASPGNPPTPPDPRPGPPPREPRAVEPDQTIQDQTIQDQFYPQAAPARSQAGPPPPPSPVPPGPSQSGPPPGAAAGHGRPGPPPPRQADPEPATMEDGPGPEDAQRTSEMRVPPGGPPQPPQPPPGADQTIVDQPAAGYAAPSSPPPPVGADDRTIATPPFHGAGPPGGPPPPGDEGRTTVLPAQGGPGQGPPPTGFQPPQGGQGAQGGGGGGLKDRLKNVKLPGRSGAPAQGGQGGDGKKSMTPLIIAAAVLSIALIGGLALGTLLSGDGEEKPKQPAVPKDFVQLADASGKIRAAVPKVWPKGQEPTWTPSTVGLADSQARPVLRATPSVNDFLGNGQTPGVFIGLTTDAGNGKLPPANAAQHPQCTKANPENYTTPDKALSGTITRYTKCTVGTPTVVEVGLRDKGGRYGVWIRIKENNSRDATKDILNSLKLAAP